MSECEFVETNMVKIGRRVLSGSKYALLTGLWMYNTEQECCIYLKLC
jgi:hypothetical protein